MVRATAGGLSKKNAIKTLLNHVLTRVAGSGSDHENNVRR